TSEPVQISSYYKKLRFFYNRMHSPDGAMHFPIKLNPKDSHVEGLQFHVNYLKNKIQENNYKRVMELGSGVGYNIVSLAEELPDVEFVGLDLTEKNLKIAKEKVAEKQLKNVQFLQANFDELNIEKYKTQDLIFSIEAMCHSADVGLIIKKCHSLLSEKGRMIVIDGYGTEKVRNGDESTLRAADYFSKGFFLPNPQYLVDATEPATEVGFQVKTTDYTENILSNFVRFEEGVDMMFRYPWFTRFLMKIKVFPIELFRHGLAGLYGPFLLKYGYAGYFLVEMKK
ncbi:MAG: class I SAM-dependent methyltransferase, partial [Saprospiraceae bacterium]